MVLVDTSIWIDHLRQANSGLLALLDAAEVVTHPFVLGELACGQLRDRADILYNLGRLQRSPVASDREVMLMIEEHDLMGRGVGYLDMHLLASVLIGSDLYLWTNDKRLAAVAGQFSVTH